MLGSNGEKSLPQLVNCVSHVVVVVMIVVVIVCSISTDW